MKLYNFFRSGTSHRLRIALRLKGLPVEYVAIDLRTDQHLLPSFAAINPQGMVPALALDGRILTQSPAIIEWLEERHPEPPLLPGDPEQRAHVRALAALIGCDVHPLNNRRVLQVLRRSMNCDETAIEKWCATWIEDGFDAFETMLDGSPKDGHFCFGDAPTIADVYLIPQVESARRFNVDVTRWPRIHAIDAACAGIDAFHLATPAKQIDAA